MTSERTRGRMLERLRQQGIGDETVLSAMGLIPRHVFIDDALAQLAQEAGATLLTKTKADNVQQANGIFTVNAGAHTYTAKLACGTWGKRSNIDVKWQRPFITGKNKALNNYIGIKYHISYPWPADVIGLHNFKNGYCGISQIEDGKYCLCYLTTAANLKNCGNACNFVINENEELFCNY